MSKIIEQPRFSCALGAQQSVVAIPRAVPIVHAGPGCSGKICALIGQGEGYAGGSTIPCTNASGSEIVFGGEERLRGVIDGAFKVIDADLYVVLTGCTSDIVGDDTGRVTRDFQDDDKPIVYAETGGFKSNNYVSHDVVVQAIIEQYVDKFKDEKATLTPGLVNVFATIPYQDPYWNGNLAELKRILEGIGLQVNILFGTESAGIGEWLTIPQAQFNILVSAWPGLEIVKRLEAKYGTPYYHFPYLPIGGNETSKFLRGVSEFGGLDPVKTEAFIRKEEEKFYSHIERTADFMLEFRYGLPRRFYTILDATYAVGFAKYLVNELGILPAKQYIIDDTPAIYQEAIRDHFRHVSELRSAEVVFSVDGGEIQAEIRGEEHKHRSLILGSGWERDLAREIHADLLPISVPITYRLVLNCGYAGYHGGLRAIEDIYDRVLDTYR
ncbi:nitrogenase component 1 [Heliophilum fasciatum]|uniref:Nitrogenase molybdenum-iron protein beta chain n=1 Tax=Heliophilum fasciatum TaxID=35700 RepID=A0A4R2RYF3_9FIRM|nr:nitrogenase component 1 [Heliophilum fasciatum]MCW2277684.1 nitrogenase molybdenum-iron protein beta chain [Heliophilum fasciatum]TCP65031.1 nitrogenase molybdenum-iron protein beta chain [Heliophilum fasciatum]